MWPKRTYPGSARGTWHLLILLTVSGTAAADIFVARGSMWRYMKGTGEPSTPPSAWRQPMFDDAAWSEAPAPFFYGEGVAGTFLGDMRRTYTSIFLRRSFDVPDPTSVQDVLLHADYDDGFIAWINGVQIYQVNGPAAATHDAVASGNHESGSFESFALPDPATFLTAGRNVIAVAAFNNDPEGADFLIDVELSMAEGVADTKFSPDRGFYDSPFSVTITTATVGATIRYTTDGSVPTESSGARYTGPIPISGTTVLRARAFLDGLEPTNVDTQTYIFLDDVLEQPRDPPGYPASWGSQSADYEVDPEVVNDPRYGPVLKDALLSIPTLSIVMEQDDLFGSSGIYYRGGSGQNAGFERSASVELINPDERPGFQIDCGIRPHSHVILKRSFKLLFKAEYGENKLRYPFFESAPLNAATSTRKFDRIILRAGTNRAWSNRWNPADTCYTRDQWARDSQVAMSGIGSRGTFVHLYLNGLYWGLYNPVERTDAWHTSAYLGGEQEDWYAMNHGGTISGDSSRYNRLKDIADARRLEEPAAYTEMLGYIEPAHFSDYLIVNWYAGTGDWPQNNYYGGNRNDPPGPFLYFCWDAEDIFDPLGSGRTGRSNDGAWVQSSFRRGASSSRTIARIWHALRENDDFMLLFADQVYRHCFNGGALTEERSRSRWLTLNEFVELAVIGESARWGDAREGAGDPLRTLDDDWRPEVERVSTVSIAGNVSRFIDALRNEQYYPTIDPPVFNRHGGQVPADFAVTLHDPAGTGGAIYYTLDGTDPREAVTGDVAETAVRFITPFTVTGTMHVKARLRVGGTWSAQAETVFFNPQELFRLRITEIMYHPPDREEVSGKEYEFIELKNTSNEALDLSAVSLTAGIFYEFPEGTILMPGDFAVLVANHDAFRQAYPGVAVNGVFSRSLSNGGEVIELRDPGGELIASVAYDDAAPWPLAADGWGYSLVPVDPNGGVDPNDPATWRSSEQVGGSPGRDDGAPPEPKPPEIIEQPRDVAVMEGDRAEFAVQATGHPAPTYQWQRNGHAIPEATAWLYQTPPLTLDDSGARFTCLVENAEGSLMSAEATLTVTVRPITGDLVPRGSTWAYYPAREAASTPPDLWRAPAFDDTAWASGSAPFGYGDPPYGTTLDDMQGNYSSVYFRRTFQLPPGITVTALTLSTDYDDGVIAWINGMEVFRFNMPDGEIPFDGVASGDHESGQFETQVVENPAALLIGGENVLACQAFNKDLSSSSDFTFDLQLTFEGVAEEPEETTPFIRGDSNMDGNVNMADAVYTLSFLFANGTPPVCFDAADTNDDGAVDVSDAVNMFQHMFAAGPSFPAPYGVCGVDPTPDAVPCATYDPCQ